MKWIWACGCGVVIMSLVSSGCVSLDEHQALQRAHRLLQEKLSEVQDDLQNEQMLSAQKDTKIASLNEQLAAKDQLINNLSAEAESLRNSLAKAEDMLKAMAGKGTSTTIVATQLPPDVDAALKKLADEYPNVFEYLSDKGAVRFKADLLFPLGSDQLTAGTEAMEALGKFAEIVQSPSVANLDIVVVGHTDTTPIRKPETLAEHKTNWHLSCHRAISMVNLLAEKGIAMTRMGAMGYGEYRPIADNSTAEGKSKNRRVEIYLVPKSSVQSLSSNVFEAKDLGIAFFKADPSDLKTTN